MKDKTVSEAEAKKETQIIGYHSSQNLKASEITKMLGKNICRN